MATIFMTPADYVVLKDELLTDPNGYGYASWITTGSLNNVAGLVNEPRPELSTTPRILLREDILATWQLSDVETMYSHPNTAYHGQARVEFACFIAEQDIPDVFDGGNYTLWSHIYNAFIPGSSTATALQALISRPASRSEILFGAAQILDWQDIHIALYET